jgi:hypothetical protein
MSRINDRELSLVRPYAVASDPKPTDSTKISFAAEKSERPVRVSVQGDPELARSFAISARSNDPSEQTAALAVHFFCSLQSRPPSMTYDQWYSTLPSLTKLGIVEKYAAAVELERKAFAFEFDKRCNSFINGDFPKETIADLRKKASQSPIALEIAKYSSITINRGVEALPDNSVLYASGDPSAYRYLTRLALREIEFESTGNDRADNVTRQYLLASVLCANGEDCSPKGLMFADNCLNLGVCNGTSAIDALQDTMRGHGVAVNSELIAQTLTRWLNHSITWTDVLRILGQKRRP